MPRAKYRNGNVVVTIDINTGTRKMETKDDEFNFEFPVSLDLNIGNKCDGGCEFCYISASPNGIDADLLHVPFIDSIHPYTEVAINGNSVDHPQLIPFLEELKRRRIIANMTVNQLHFERKEKHSHSKEYISLFRRYNLIMIVIIASLVLEYYQKLFN